MKQLVYLGGGSPRLDKFLQEQLPGLPAGQLHKYLRQNKIKLNGQRRPLSTRLHNGDEVRLYLPEGAGTERNAPPLKVLFEDKNLLAVVKPAGLISLPARGDAASDSMLARVLSYLGEKGEYQPGAAFAPALCHRLDTGTSGVLLVAKNARTLHWVQGLIQEHRLIKTYCCVTVGHPRPEEGSLEGWLFKDARRGQVKIYERNVRGAKPVELHYKTLVQSVELALLEIELVTGRTHQIRAQMAHAGTPLLGDSRYGQLAANRRYRCRYQCLCAQSIRFPVIRQSGFEAYSKLLIEGDKPWFYRGMMEGTLG